MQLHKRQRTKPDEKSLRRELAWDFLSAPCTIQRADERGV